MFWNVMFMIENFLCVYILSIFFLSYFSFFLSFIPPPPPPPPFFFHILNFDNQEKKKRKKRERFFDLFLIFSLCLTSGLSKKAASHIWLGMTCSLLPCNCCWWSQHTQAGQIFVLSLVLAWRTENISAACTRVAHHVQMRGNGFYMWGCGNPLLFYGCVPLV